MGADPRRRRPGLRAGPTRRGVVSVIATHRRASAVRQVFGLFIALATAALAIDDCVFIDFIDFGDEDDEDREDPRDQDVPPHLRAAAAAA